MNRLIFRGLTTAMLVNSMAFAADAYEPAEYQAKENYAIASTPTAQEVVATTNRPEDAEVNDDATALQSEAVPVEAGLEKSKKVNQESSRAAGGGAVIVSPSEQVSGSSNTSVFIIAGLAAIGMFFFRRKARPVSSEVSGCPSELQHAPTGVEKYIEKLTGTQKTGVEKYLDNLPETAPLTGVAKYLARQGRSGRK
ncbi:MAG: hypothetical protein PHH11_15350 [Methylomonas sp.]|nr:hypothetical protein [Methylomonas sp.]